MKEMYFHCRKYNQWKKKEEFAKEPVVCLECEDPRRTNCGLCQYNEIQYLDEERKMYIGEIEKQYKEGHIDMTFILEGLLDQFKRDKTSLDVQQLQLLTEYLINKLEVNGSDGPK